MRHRRRHRQEQRSLGGRVAAALALGTAYNSIPCGVFAFAWADLPRSRLEGRSSSSAFRSRAASQVSVESVGRPHLKVSAHGLVAAAAIIARVTRRTAVAQEVGASVEEEVETEEVEERILVGGAANEIVEAVKNAAPGGDPVMAVQNLIVDQVSLLQAMRSLRLSSLHDDVLRLFEEFGIESELTESAAIYAERIAAAFEVGSSAVAFESWTEMRARLIKPNLQCFNVMFKFYGRNRSGDKALQLLAEMVQQEVKPDASSYESILLSLPTRKQWDRMLGLLRRMEAGGVKLTAAGYKHAMHSLSYSPHYERCIQLYTGMREEGIMPDEDTLRYMLRSCFGSEDCPQDLDVALSVFRKLDEDSSVTLTEVHFDMAIHSSAKAKRWSDVLQLASAMGARGVNPHHVTCNVVLQACVELGKSDIAVKLVGTMSQDGTDLDIIAFGTVINACAAAKQWDEVLDLYSEVKSRFSEHPADIIMCAVTAMAEVGSLEDAMQLYREKGISQQMPYRRSDPVLLDARMRSPQVASILVRCALEEIAKSSKRRGQDMMSSAGATKVTQDIVVAVDATDFDDGEAQPGSASEDFIQVAKEILGEDAGIEFSSNPFPSVKISGIA